VARTENELGLSTQSGCSGAAGSLAVWKLLSFESGDAGEASTSCVLWGVA
jgi:hypothetical protein